MDLKKEFFQKNIKQETEIKSECRRIEEPIADVCFLQIKHEDTNQESDIIHTKEASNNYKVQVIHNSETDKLCRLCARPILDHEICLFKTTDLEQKINYSLPIKASAGDGLPEHICEHCKINLDTFYNFVCQVKKADKIFRNKLNVNDAKSNNATDTLIRQIFGEDSNESTLMLREESVLEIKPSHNSPSPNQQDQRPTNNSIKEDDCNEEPPSKILRSGTRQFLCPESGCTNVYSTEKHLREHVKEKHHVPVICYTCGKLFIDPDALKKHRQKMHSNKICEKCWMTFESNFSYKQHELLHLKLSENQCVYCLKVFDYPGKLRRHTRCHMGHFTLV